MNITIREPSKISNNKANYGLSLAECSFKIVNVVNRFEKYKMNSAVSSNSSSHWPVSWMHWWKTSNKSFSHNWEIPKRRFTSFLVQSILDFCSIKDIIESRMVACPKSLSKVTRYFLLPLFRTVKADFKALWLC